MRSLTIIVKKLVKNK